VRLHRRASIILAYEESSSTEKRKEKKRKKQRKKERKKERKKGQGMTAQPSFQVDSTFQCIEVGVKTVWEKETLEYKLELMYIATRSHDSVA
jgi:hypothetical protein